MNIMGDIDILMTALWTIFRRSPTTCRRFPRAIKNLSEGQTNVANIFTRRFSKMSEDIRRLPKTFEDDPKMSRSYSNEFKSSLRDKLDISEFIDIFTTEDMENTSLESRMYFRMSGVFSSSTLVSIY